MKIFAERLRKLRKEKNMTMKELAKEIGTSDVSINNWENGINEPKITYLKRLASFFNISADYLIGLEDESGAKNYINNSFNNFNNTGNFKI